MIKSAAGEIISISAIDKNTLQDFEAKIKGPPDTPYENGVFVIEMQLSTEYPLVPPKVTLKTKVFHPNINSEGQICLDILDKAWYKSLRLETILLSISLLLSTPNVDDFLVPEAAFLYKENRTEFNRKAREWTRKYAMSTDLSVELPDNLTQASSPYYSHNTRFHFLSYLLEFRFIEYKP